MFLHLLNPQEKSAFLTLAQLLIESDGIIAEQEAEMLRRMADEMEISTDIDVSLSEVLAIATFQSQRAKDAAMLELIGLAYADDSFAPEEHVFINRVATGFAISQVRFMEMDAWVGEVKSLTVRAATQLISA